MGGGDLLVLLVIPPSIGSPRLFSYRPDPQSSLGVWAAAHAQIQDIFYRLWTEDQWIDS